jgi:glycosyltransferase involved in cell wall biosynthesis
MMPTPLLSVLVPVYNEERTLSAIMDRIALALPDAQIVYVDDGSEDGSLGILRTKARPQDLVLTKPNGGKGSAIRHGLAQATGTYAVIQDADLEYDPAEILLLLAEAEQYPGSAVFGSRFLKPNPNIYKRFLLGNKTLTLVMNILYGARLTDTYTCFKLLPADAFRSLSLTANGFELEAEICAKCLRRGIVIRELPISYKPRTIEEGKKINWRDAVRGLWMMAKLRFGGR